jgi:hypothetical protein
MARHHEENDYSWVWWVAGAVGVYYLYSTGVFTSLLTQLGTLSTSSLLSAATTTPTAQGKIPTTPTAALTQVEPNAVYVNDVNVSDIDQYSQ